MLDKFRRNYPRCSYTNQGFFDRSSNPTGQSNARRLAANRFTSISRGRRHGGGLPLKSGRRPPTAVIGAQIKSLNAEIKHPICLTTIFLAVFKRAVFAPAAGGRQGRIGVVIILNTVVTDTSYRPAATLGAAPPDSSVIEMNR